MLIVGARADVLGSRPDRAERMEDDGGTMHVVLADWSSPQKSEQGAIPKRGSLVK